MDVTVFSGQVEGVLANPDGPPRPAFVWDDVNGITLSFEFFDSKPRLFGIYCLDGNGQGRIQSITVTSAQGTELPFTLSNFGGGKYLFWYLSGPIQIQVVPGADSPGN